MAKVTLLTGPHRSGRSNAIDQRVANAWGRVRFVLPTRQAAQRRLDTLIVTHNLPGAWGAPVKSLEDFAREIVSTHTPHLDIMDELDRRLLLDRALQTLPTTVTDHLPDGVLTSPGFASHMLRIITQLKQAAVTPDEFSRRVAKRAKPSWIDPVVSGVYDAYQKALEGTTQFDRVGVYWMAADLCAATPPVFLNEIDLIAFDEFDDFTPSEFRLIDALARSQKSEIVIGLVLDTQQPAMSDVYSIPHRTFNSIRNAFDGSRLVSYDELPPDTETAFAASHVFRRDMSPAPGNLRKNLTLTPKADALQEAEHIARRIKALVLDETVPITDIAVAYRNISESAALLRSVFAEFGVPAIVQADVPLTQSSIVSHLMNRFEAVTTWTREAICDTIMSPWYVPVAMTNEDRTWTARLALEAGVVSGRDAWSKHLEALRNRCTKDNRHTQSIVRRLPYIHDIIARFSDELNHIDAWSRKLTASGNLSEHATAILSSFEMLSIDKAIAMHPVQTIAESEARAYKAFTRLIIRMAAQDGHAIAMDRASFVALLRQALRFMIYTPARPEAGVRCVDLANLRHTPARYVFVGGANEGELPSPPSANAIYSDADYADLHSAGIPFDTKSDHMAREMLLFHHALSSAREALEISWRLVSRQGKAATESAFISDLRMLGVGCVGPCASTADFVPPPDRIASSRDWCNACVTSNRVDLLGDEFASSAHAIRVEAIRHSTDPFGVYDGVISDPILKAALVDSFGPDHVFSVSQLERYAESPFAYFLNRVLDVYKVDIPESDFDPRVRGQILHTILERFHTQYRGIPVANIPRDDAWNAMRQITVEEFDRMGHFGGSTAGVSLMERRHAEVLLRRYLELQGEDPHVAWKPMYFETGFGRQGAAAGETSNQKPPYVYAADGMTILLAGRIDRIDENEGAMRVIDYKTRIRTDNARLNEGINLQLGVYSDAVELYLFPGSRCEQAFYLRVGAKEMKGAKGSGKVKLEDLRAIAREKCAAYVSQIRDGCFPPTSSDNQVPYDHRAHRPCRYERWRVENKQASTP